MFGQDAQAVGSLDDPRVIQEVETYREALLSGKNPDRQQLLERFPAIADELAVCLDGLEFVRDLAPDVDRQAKQLGGDMAARPQIPLPGTLGDFRLIREIGRGGMGVVYEAEQVSLRRKMALKTLPFAAVLDSRQLQRFQNEALAAASLRHPNIVQVHSVGCERGIHYYAMDYIEGQTLAELIHQLRECEKADSRQQAAVSNQQSAVSIPTPLSRRTGEGQGVRAASDQSTADLPLSPTPPLPLSPTPPAPDTKPEPQAAVSTKGSHRTAEFFRSVADLGIQAAEALEHAHQLGIVHRDIKPSNLIVGESGEPRAKSQAHSALSSPLSDLRLWVTDFGLAQTQTGVNLTLTGDILGTLRYMSPEQAAGRSRVLDHRTDIYSLGVTLYELLTLRAPFPGEDRQSVLRQIADEAPPQPRSVNPAIPRDLETIVLKAMSKEPQARYATAQELADDLARFLEDKPILARPPSLADRAAKWSRRHKTLVAATASISAILLVAGILVAMSQRELAQRRLRVQQGINEALTEVARLRAPSQTAALGDETALAQAREQLQRAVALAESGPTAPDVLAQVQGLLGELNQEQRDRQLLADLEAAWLEDTNLDPTGFARDYQSGLFKLRKALEAYGLRLGEGAPQDVATVIASRPPPVRDELVAALEEWLTRIPSLGVGVTKLTDKAIIEVMPDSPAAKDGRLKTGDTLIGVGQEREGPITHTRAMTSVEIISKLLRGKPGTFVRLEVVPQGQSKPQTYAIQREPALAWLRTVMEAADTDPWRRRLREAYDLQDRRQRRAALEKLANEPEVHRQPVRVLVRFAESFYGDPEGNNRAIALMREVCRRHPGDLKANIRLATLLVRITPPRLEEAARHRSMAVALRPDSPAAHQSLAFVFSRQKEIDAAIAEYREAIRLNPGFAIAHCNLASCLGLQGKWDEAVAEYREAIRFASLLSDGPQRTNFVAGLHSNLGGALEQDGKLEEAIAAHRDAVRLWPNGPSWCDQLAWLLATAPDPKWRQPAEAVALAKKTVALAPQGGRYWRTLGAAEYHAGNHKAAIESLGKSIKLSSGGDAAGGFLLAMAHWQLGDKDEGRTWYDKAVQCEEKEPPENERLLRVRAEAAQLLGIPERPPAVKEKPKKESDAKQQKRRDQGASSSLILRLE